MGQQEMTEVQRPVSDMERGRRVNGVAEEEEEEEEEEERKGEKGGVTGREVRGVCGFSLCVFNRLLRLHPRLRDPSSSSLL